MPTTATLKLLNKFNRVDVRRELYTGVVMFTKDVCGMDFLRSLEDGRVRIELSDTSALYRIHGVHFKNKQKYTASGFTFDLLSVELKDMPWTFKVLQIFVYAQQVVRACQKYKLNSSLFISERSCN